MFHVKETSWNVILTWLVLSLSTAAFINLVLFPSPVFGPIARATANLIGATLQANLLNLLLFGLIVFGWAKLRPADVGLQWNKLGQAVALTLSLWLATQAVVLLVNWVSGDVHLHPIWRERGLTAVLGALLGQLAGNALFEEMNYRGFYLSQFYRKVGETNERRKRTWAVLAMLGLFILSHIPNRIYSGYRLQDIPLDFLLLFAWGLFFTLVYLVSDNLFLAVGVHALANTPTLITESPFPPQFVLFLVTCLLLVLLRRRNKQVEATQPVLP